MARPQRPTTAVPEFVEITDKFFRQYHQAADKLEELEDDLLWNRRYAQHWEALGDAGFAKQLRKCNQYFSGNDLNGLRPCYYCRRPYSCRRCRRILVSKRVEQWTAVVNDFRQGSRCELLTMHRFLIRPDAFAIPISNDTDRFQFMIQALQLFRRNLRFAFQRHSLSYCLANPDYSLSLSKQKARMYGPIVTSLHLVPREVQVIAHGTFAHLHVSVITTRYTSKQVVTKLLQRVWNNTRKALPVQYTTGEREVIRWQQPRESREAGTPKFRVGQFQVIHRDWWKGDDESVLGTAAYLAEPFKQKFSPEVLLKCEQLLAQCGLTTDSLYQFIGNEGIKRKRIPGGFDGQRLKHKYHAVFTDAGKWRVFLKH